MNSRINCGFYNFFLSCSLKNAYGLTALDIAASRAEENKGYFYISNFEGVIELLNKRIQVTTDPPSHHVSSYDCRHCTISCIDILDME